MNQAVPHNTFEADRDGFLIGQRVDPQDLAPMADLSGMESRLDAIEVGIGSVEDVLRSIERMMRAAPRVSEVDEGGDVAGPTPDRSHAAGRAVAAGSSALPSSTPARTGISEPGAPAAVARVASDELDPAGLGDHPRPEAHHHSRMFSWVMKDLNLQPMD